MLLLFSSSIYDIPATDLVPFQCLVEELGTVGTETLPGNKSRGMHYSYKRIQDARTA